MCIRDRAKTPPAAPVATSSSIALYIMSRACVLREGKATRARPDPPVTIGSSQDVFASEQWANGVGNLDIVA
eukprot:12713771-Prorocentrum_lima.AAC.1